MSNFLFAVNATMPVFLVILLGWLLRRWGVINDAFASAGNKYVFKCALPVSLLQSLGTMDLYTDFNWQFCLFCAVGTFLMFSLVWAGTVLLMRDKTMIGAFAQASARSSAAILGVAFAVNIYGDAGLVPMMIVAAVPLFNIFAVLILCFSPQTDENGNLLPPPKDTAEKIRRAVVGVFTNPILIGIFAGSILSLLRIQMPPILAKTVSMVGGTAPPIALIVVGASFSTVEAMKKWKPAAVATFIKLFLLPAIYLPIAAALGFRNTEMIAILIMVGSPTTVACYIMAKNMHNDGVLTSNVVVLSTLLSSISLTMWIFLLRTFALI